VEEIFRLSLLETALFHNSRIVLIFSISFLGIAGDNDSIGNENSSLRFPLKVCRRI
jgi:hypothetical protein